MPEREDLNSSGRADCYLTRFCSDTLGVSCVPAVQSCRCLQPGKWFCISSMHWSSLHLYGFGVERAQKSWIVTLLAVTEQRGFKGKGTS